MSLQLYTDSMREAWLGAHPGMGDTFDKWLSSVRADGAVDSLASMGRAELVQAVGDVLGPDDELVEPSDIESIVKAGPGAARDEETGQYIVGVVGDLAVACDEDVDVSLRDGESTDPRVAARARTDLQQALVLGHGAHAWISEHAPVEEPEDRAHRALYLGDLGAVERLRADGEQETLGHLVEDVDEMTFRYERAGLTPATPDLEQVGIHARAAERQFVVRARNQDRMLHAVVPGIGSEDPSGPRRGAGYSLS